MEGEWMYMNLIMWVFVGDIRKVGGRRYGKERPSKRLRLLVDGFCQAVLYRDERGRNTTLVRTLPVARPLSQLPHAPRALFDRLLHPLAMAS